MKDALGVAIIGCGYMGAIHAESWHRHPQARLAAVVDVKPERAARLAQVYHLEESFTDYRAAIQSADVDVVSVCVPTCDHAEIAIGAAEAGAHILCEKPIALTVEDAECMIAAAERNGVMLTPGFMRRYSQVVTEMRSVGDRFNLPREYVSRADCQFCRQCPGGEAGSGIPAGGP